MNLKRLHLELDKCTLLLGEKNYRKWQIERRKDWRKERKKCNEKVFKTRNLSTAVLYV